MYSGVQCFRDLVVVPEKKRENKIDKYIRFRKNKNYNKS